MRLINSVSPLYNFSKHNKSEMEGYFWKVETINVTLLPFSPNSPMFGSRHFGISKNRYIYN